MTPERSHLLERGDEAGVVRPHADRDPGPDVAPPQGLALELPDPVGERLVRPPLTLLPANAGLASAVPRIADFNSAVVAVGLAASARAASAATAGEAIDVPLL